MIRIDPSSGSHVLGSRFGRLLTAYREREEDEYPHTTIGRLKFDGNWLTATLKGDVQDYYAWYIKQKFGIKLQVRSLRGPHVSIIRGEPLKANADKWGAQADWDIPIHYTHGIFTNGEHWWLNVQGEELAKLRAFYGLGANKKWFHLTIGRL